MSVKYGADRFPNMFSDGK